jgi:hypothetical protein
MADLFRCSQDVTDNKLETFYEPHRILDLDKSLNQINPESKIVLYGSDLNQKSRKLLIQLGIDKKLKVTNTFR